MNTLENSCFQFQENDEASKECIRIMNERYKSASPSLSDNFRGYDEHYYSLIDGMKNCDKNDHSRNGTVIPATEYLALLTGKQLTEGDFAHVSEHQSAMEYLQTPSLKEMESQPKLLPTQESVKDGSLGIEFGEQAQNAFDHYEYPSLINTLDTSVAFWIGWRQAEIFFSTQQTAHLQQQLKEAKEKIQKARTYIHDLPEMDYDSGQALMEREKPCANCKETIAECACMRNICVKCNKPVGNITFSHCDKCFDILHSEPTQESVKERNGDPSMDEMIQLVEQLESDKFHLQQQLKQAKELLKKMESYLDDEVSIVQAAVSSDNYACINDAQLPSLYLKINQFLTRNK